MPICKKCGDKFASRITINGKQSNICNRKYCLKCSPFNCHNTRKLEIPIDSVIAKRKSRHLNKPIRKCVVCGNLKPIPLTNAKCSNCRSFERRMQQKEKAILILGGKCKICGYDKCIKALDFHHINPKDKKFNISLKLGYPWSEIEAEIKKCVLLCNRCHSEVHEGICIL